MSKDTGEELKAMASVLANSPQTVDRMIRARSRGQTQTCLPEIARRALTCGVELSREGDRLQWLREAIAGAWRARF